MGGMSVSGRAGSCGLGAVQLVAVGLAAGVALGAVTGASAAPAAMESSAAGASGAEVGCARPLVDVVWGFVLVLLALTISLWGSLKHREDSKGFKFVLLLYGVFAPLQDLKFVIHGSWACVAMVWKCHRLEDPEMKLMSVKWVKILLSLLNPWSKLPARILSNCYIIVYLPNGASQESKEMSSGQSEGLEKAKEGVKRDLESSVKSNEVSCGRSELLDAPWKWVWCDSLAVVDESEAMVVGEDGARERKSKNYVKKELSCDGTLALLWGTHFSKDEKHKFLPDYHRLKFLRGNSGFATIAIAIQALGYIYATLFRSMKGLRVAPIEVIGLILNMILLIKASLYSTSNPCHRPLIIYMNKEREEKFLGVLESKPSSSFSVNLKSLNFYVSIMVLIIVLCLYIPLIYYIVILKRKTNIMIVLPLVIFLIGLFAHLLADNIYESWNYSITILNSMTILEVLSFLANGTAYVWAMLVTIYYWKLQYFNARPELVDLSQIIPFIG